MREQPLKWPQNSDQNSDLYKKALGISQILRDRGYLVYWAGGCVRDTLLGRTPKDIDIATNAPVEEIQTAFPRNVDVGKQFGVIVVPQDGTNFEIATFRTDGTYADGRRPTSIKPSDAKGDAERRDFTMNALFWDPFQEKIIDYTGGLDDLKHKIVRAIGNAEERFREDKLRLLRGIRFSVEFEFPLEENTAKAIRTLAPEITVVSMERIRDELVKMWTGRAPHKAMEMLSDFGFLKIILPEIEQFKGVEQPPEYHPEGDVWVHVMLMLSYCSYAPLELVLGVLFHDIAKPATFERAADRIRFHHHQRLGVPMTEEILTRLKFSNKTIQLVQDLVAQHMRFGDVHKMKPGKLKSFVMQEHFETHLELHRIDCMGSHKLMGNHELCQKTLEELKNQPQLAQPLLTGKDLISLGFKPGPQFKEILDEVREGQLDGTLISQEDAISFVKKKHHTSSSRR